MARLRKTIGFFTLYSSCLQRKKNPLANSDEIALTNDGKTMKMLRLNLPPSIIGKSSFTEFS